eukprot:3783451-Prymnesium_polylepis.1
MCPECLQSHAASLRLEPADEVSGDVLQAIEQLVCGGSLASRLAQVGRTPDAGESQKPLVQERKDRRIKYLYE